MNYYEIYDTRFHKTLIGLTDDKEIIYKFLKQNKMDTKFNLDITKKKGRTTLIEDNDYFIIEHDGMWIRNIDLNTYEDMIGEEEKRMDYVLEEVSRILKSYKLKDKEIDTIEKIIELLTKLKKRKRISKRLNLVEACINLCNPRNRILDELNERGGRQNE